MTVNALSPHEKMPDSAASFERTLGRYGLGSLTRDTPTTLQINLGKLCNQACHHCHVDAGPGRKERMSAAVARRLMTVLAASPAIGTVDVTGGAPELNDNFGYIVESARALGRH